MHAAASKDQVEVVELLINNECDMEAMDDVNHLLFKEPLTSI